MFMDGKFFEGFPVDMACLFLVGFIAGIEYGEGDVFIHEYGHGVVPCGHVCALEGYADCFRGEWCVGLDGV